MANKNAKPVTASRPGGMKGKEVSAKMREKPGYPEMGLPGKAGPDRSNGVKKARTHPKSMGL